MEAVYVQSFRFFNDHCILFKMLYKDCPNVHNWFINTFNFITVHSPQTIAWYSFTVIGTVNWTVQLA